MRIFVYSLIPVLYIGNLFWHLPAFDIVLTILAVIAISVSLLHVHRLYLFSSLLFLTAGVLISVYSNVPLSEWFRAFHPMMNVLGIFLVIPFIQGIMKTGRFDKSMKQLICYRLRGGDDLYRRTSLATYLLAVFLTIATLPVGIQSFGKAAGVLEKPGDKLFLSHAMLRAYSLALLWSPVELLVVVSMDQTRGNYLLLLPILLSISLIYLLLDWSLHKRKYSGLASKPVFAAESSLLKLHLIKAGQLILAIVILLILVLLTDHFLHLGMMVAITLVLAPFSLIWSMMLNKLSLFLRLLRKMWVPAMRKTANFYAVFLSAGFFITMGQKSILFDYVNRFVQYQMVHLPLLLFFSLLALLFWLMSFTGFHSVVTITLLANIVVPLSPGMSDSLALLFVGSAISLLMVSPFNMATSIMATLLDTGPVNLIRWNYPFAVAFVTAAVLAAYSLALLQN